MAAVITCDACGEVIAEGVHWVEVITFLILDRPPVSERDGMRRTHFHPDCHPAPSTVPARGEFPPGEVPPERRPAPQG